MFARYAAAPSYADEGKATMITHRDSQPDVTRHMSFQTVFERETSGFSFVARPADDATRAGADGAGDLAIWQPVNGRAKVWWSGRPAVRSSTVRDAIASYSFFTGGVSSRVPAWLLRHPGELADRKFRVLGDEMVGNVACVKVGVVDTPPSILWIGKSDHSLRRTVDTRWIRGPQPYELEVQVDYTPQFDLRLAPERFGFEPPVIEPLRDECAGRGATGNGRELLIDDLEDGDLWIRKVDQREGRWWRYGDDDCDVTGSDFAEAVSGENPSHYAAHASAKNCGAWGFGLGLGLNEVSAHCGYDAAAYDGVSFWASTGNTTQTVSFIVHTRQTVPLEFGGDGSYDAAEQPRWDGFGINVKVNADWHAYSFKWADLHQAGFGSPTTFDARQIVGLFWQTPTRADGSTSELWLDQVSFFKGSPPASPFTPAPEP